MTTDPDTDRALTPLDEARIAHAHALQRLVHQGLEYFPTEQREPGTVLGDALDLVDLAHTLARAAAVLERERGANWADIAEGAHRDEDETRERWQDAVRSWTALGRRRGRTERDGLRVAGDLDAWYRTLDPEVEHAVTARLDALDPRDVVAQDAARRDRDRAAALREREWPLAKAAQQAYESNSRPAWAAAVHAQAALYDELADAEPLLADEHRATANNHRTNADTIAARPGSQIHAGVDADPPTTDPGSEKA